MVVTLARSDSDTTLPTTHSHTPNGGIDDATLRKILAIGYPLGLFVGIVGGMGLVISYSFSGSFPLFIGGMGLMAVTALFFLGVWACIPTVPTEEKRSLIT